MNSSRAGSRPPSHFLLIVVLSTLLHGCAAPTRIASNKAQGYTSQPKRIFVVTDIGSEFGQAYADAFRSRFTQIVSACGITSRISQISALELDETARVRLMESFGPDAILAIRRNGGVVNELGAVLRVKYDMRLSDVSAQKVVWRAEANVVRGAYLPMADRGETVAVEVTNKMKLDGLFGTCAAVAMPNDPLGVKPAPAKPEVDVMSSGGTEAPKIRAEEMAGKVPYLDAARQAAYQDFLKFKSPRAFAISDNGHSGRASGIMRSSTEPSDPRERAVKRCSDAAGKPCFLYAVDEFIVFVPTRDGAGGDAKLAAPVPSREPSCQPEFDVTSPSRTMAEVMQVLKCKGAAMHAVYFRALESHPGLSGSLVFRMEIAPSGQVTSCVVKSSNLALPQVEIELAAVLRRIDFGPKGNRLLVINYPVELQPS